MLTERRRFIATAGGVMAAAAAATIADAPYVIAQPKVQWRMSTAFAAVFNKKAYETLPVDLRRTLDHAVAAVMVYGLTDFHVKNAVALQRLRTEFKGSVEIVQFPAPMLRDLRKLAGEVIKEESEKTPTARKVHASYAKFQALVSPWDRVAEGAYHQLVAG